MEGPNVPLNLYFTHKVLERKPRKLGQPAAAQTGEALWWQQVSAAKN